jgi:hypothetical protein
MTEHTKRIVQQLQQEPTNAQGVRDLLKKARQGTRKFFDRCKYECRKANCMKPQVDHCKEVHANETGKRKAENTSPDQSSSANTPIEGDETNFGEQVQQTTTNQCRHTHEANSAESHTKSTAGSNGQRMSKTARDSILCGSSRAGTD